MSNHNTPYRTLKKIPSGLMKNLIRLNDLVLPAKFWPAEPKDESKAADCPFCTNPDVHYAGFINCSGEALNVEFMGAWNDDLDKSRKKFQEAVRLWESCWVEMEVIMAALLARKSDATAQDIYWDLRHKRIKAGLALANPRSAQLKRHDPVAGDTQFTTCPFHEFDMGIHKRDLAVMAKVSLHVEFTGVGDSFGLNEKLWEAFRGHLPEIIRILGK